MLKASELKAFLNAHEVHLTKRLGQHHLIDTRVIERVLAQLELPPGRTVVEIGPGLGALTQPLAQRGVPIVAVEIDRKVAELLRARLQAYPQVDVRCEDILSFAWPQQDPVTVLGAIPYHVTSAILVALSAHRRQIRQAVLIMQQEVAARLVARPSTKAYGRLSVLVQYGWEVKRLFDLPRQVFFPAPRVDSTCVELRPQMNPPVAVRDEAAFFALVKAAFGQRRKTLANTLVHDRERSWGAARAVQEALARLQLPPAIRGEALTLAQFAALTNELSLR